MLLNCPPCSLVPCFSPFSLCVVDIWPGPGHPSLLGLLLVRGFLLPGQPVASLQAQGQPSERRDGCSPGCHRLLLLLHFHLGKYGSRRVPARPIQTPGCVPLSRWAKLCFPEGTCSRATCSLPERGSPLPCRGTAFLRMRLEHHHVAQMGLEPPALASEHTPHLCAFLSQMESSLLGSPHTRRKLPIGSTFHTRKLGLSHFTMYLFIFRNESRGMRKEQTIHNFVLGS